jgi:hypothetical protein
MLHSIHEPSAIAVRSFELEVCMFSLVPSPLVQPAGPSGTHGAILRDRPPSAHRSWVAG